MKIIVTGSRGFLGRRLVQAVAARGDEVLALVRPGTALARRPPDAQCAAIHEATVEGLADLFQRHESIAGVIHAATHYGRETSSAVECLRVNTLFPLQLLERSVVAGVPVFVHCDTCFNAGPRNQYQYLPAYQLSKRHFSHWGDLIAANSAIRFVNARLFHPYGPGDDPAKFVPSIIRDLVVGVPELKLTPGEQERDFLFVDDAAAALVCLLDRAGDLPAGYLNIDCGRGETVTIRQFVETAHRLAGSSTKLLFGALPYRNNEMMKLKADPSRLRSLGWRPLIDLEQGLNIIIQQGRVEATSPSPERG